MNPLLVEVLNALGTVAVIATAFVAIISMNAWRKQHIGKRRFTVAEETLLAFYDVELVLNYARNGVGYGGEAVYGEPTPEGETRDEYARERDNYFVPIKRLNDEKETFAKLRTLRHLCSIHFGKDAREPFQAINEIHSQVISSARMLIRIVGGTSYDNPDEATEKRVRRWQAHIWDEGDEGNELSEKTDTAIVDIEKICLPHLKQNPQGVFGQNLASFYTWLTTSEHEGK